MISQIPDPQPPVENPVSSLKLWRIIPPVLLGLAAAFYLLYTQFDRQQFEAIQWNSRAWILIGAAFLLLLLRHFSYALRLMAVTGYIFPYKKYLQLMVLWEFSTTLMPTSKGGPLVMLFALTKEGVPAGKTTAAVFYTIFLDTGFFVLLVPIITAFFGSGMLLPASFGSGALAVAGGVFWTTYAVMASYWILLAVLLLVRPQWVPVVFGRLARLRVLSRWKAKIEKLALDFSEAAIFMRKQPVRVHFHAIFGTLGAWTLKFAMINCLVLAIAPQVPVDGYTQMFIYARMVAMFLIMAFSPTPGGAGLAEIALPQFMSDIIPTSLGLVVALIWRGMAYYGYIIAGAIVVPAWVSKWRK